MDPDSDPEHWFSHSALDTVRAFYVLMDRSGFLLINVVDPEGFWIRILTVLSTVFGPPESGSVRQKYRSGSFHHQAKIVSKTLIPTIL